jgi:hypothetical protein
VVRERAGESRDRGNVVYRLHTPPCWRRQTTRRHGPRRRGAAVDEDNFGGCEKRHEERTADPESNPEVEVLQNAANIRPAAGRNKPAKPRWRKPSGQCETAKAEHERTAGPVRPKELRKWLWEWTPRPMSVGMTDDRAHERRVREPSPVREL